MLSGALGGAITCALRYRRLWLNSMTRESESMNRESKLHELLDARRGASVVFSRFEQTNRFEIPGQCDNPECPEHGPEIKAKRAAAKASAN